MSSDRSNPTDRDPLGAPAAAAPPERRPHFSMTWAGPRGSMTLSVYDPDLQLVCGARGCVALAARDPAQFAEIVRALAGGATRTEE